MVRLYSQNWKILYAETNIVVLCQARLALLVDHEEELDHGVTIVHTMGIK